MGKRMRLKDDGSWVFDTGIYKVNEVAEIVATRLGIPIPLMSMQSGKILTVQPQTEDNYTATELSNIKAELSKLGVI